MHNQFSKIGLIGLFFSLSLNMLFSQSAFQIDRSQIVKSGVLIRIEQVFTDGPFLQGSFDQVFVSGIEATDLENSSFSIDWTQVFLVNTFTLNNSSSNQKAASGAECSQINNWKRIPHSLGDEYQVLAKTVKINCRTKSQSVGKYIQFARDAHFASNFEQPRFNKHLEMKINVANDVELCDK